MISQTTDEREARGLMNERFPAQMKPAKEPRIASKKHSTGRVTTKEVSAFNNVHLLYSMWRASMSYQTIKYIIIKHNFAWARSLLTVYLLSIKQLMYATLQLQFEK